MFGFSKFLDIIKITFVDLQIQAKLQKKWGENIKKKIMFYHILEIITYAFLVIDKYELERDSQGI